MQIIRKSQGIETEKPEGTKVIYYILPEYEVHFNEMPGNSIQQWHYHNAIEELIYIVSGQIDFHWTDNGKNLVETLYPGDIVRVENDPHTLENSLSVPATFIVVRLVLVGKEYGDLFRNDKVVI